MPEPGVGNSVPTPEKLWDVSLAELAAELGGDLTPSARAAMVGSNMERTLDLMFTMLGRCARPGSPQRW